MGVVEVARISELAAALASERERSRRLEAQLRNLADSDPLTDLLNRRSIEHELEGHLARCARYGPEGALLLGRVDGLAAIADAAGQAVADEALATLAGRIVARLRETDVVGRWGAHEVAVLLPRATTAEVAVVVSALLEVVGGTGTSRVRPGSLVASFGVAVVTSGPLARDLLVARAGDALARAAQGGGEWVLAAAQQGGST